MKKRVILYLAIIVWTNILAQDVVVDYVAYNLDKKNLTAEVTSLNMGFFTLTPKEGNVVLPNTVTFKGRSYMVTSVGKTAFADVLNLYTIIIPDGVEKIGENAFSGCKNLYSVTLPNTITTIDKRAFANCRDLTSIIIPESCTFIGDLAFAWSGLSEITIGKGIKEIGGKAFMKCNLKTVNYPAGIDVKDMNFPATAQLIAYNPEHSAVAADNAAKQTVEQPKEKASAIHKSVVDTDIPMTNASNPNTFVVIFANEDYKNVASVPFAKNDGGIFQKYCQNTLGIPASHIHYVENAGLNDIRIHLVWLNDVCNAFEGKASLIVYYAGHGFPDEESKSSYLLPIDGDSRYLVTAYKLDEFYQKLGSMNAKSITVFMDACFSGSKREEGMLASARGVALKARPGSPKGNMVVFSAAQGDETAYPITDEQHGMFTYFLLKKLQETKGEVTLQELGNYITFNVKQQSIVHNGKLQTPCVTPASAVVDQWQNWKLK